MIRSIRTRREFAELRRSGRRYTAGPFTMIVSLDASQEDASLGFAVGKRLGNAVVRNKLRRRLREIFRDLDRQGGLAPGQYFLMCRPGAQERSFAELHDVVTGLVAAVHPS